MGYYKSDEERIEQLSEEVAEAERKIDDLRDEVAAQTARAEEAEASLAEREALLHECNAVCLCGCPPEAHESLGEDGESCGDDEHECVRTSHAVAMMLASLRTALVSERNAARAALAEERERMERAEARAEKAALALTRAHEVVAQQRSLIDPSEYPEIDAAAGEVIDPCDEFADRMDRAECALRLVTEERDRLRNELAALRAAPAPPSREVRSER